MFVESRKLAVDEASGFAEAAPATTGSGKTSSASLVSSGPVWSPSTNDEPEMRMSSSENRPDVELICFDNG